MDSKGILSELSCTICFEVVVSPILNCENGHLVCGLCSEKISECPLCDKDLAVSYFAERLVRKHEFKRECVNQNSGCTEIIKCADMKNHLDICEFRKLYKCYLCLEYGQVNEMGSDPNNSGYSTEEFGVHLLDVHDLQEIVNGLSWITPMSESWDTMIFIGWDGVIIREYGSVFILHTAVRESMNRWITILGNENEANKYDYVISIKPCAFKDQHKIGLVWRLPVIPHIGNATFDEVSKSGKYCSIHRLAVESLFVSSSRSFEDSFPMVNVKIVKVETEKNDENIFQFESLQ